MTNFHDNMIDEAIGLWAEFSARITAAVDWNYLTVLAGRMARKSELDAWLMNRYHIDAATARTISNIASEERCFITSSSGATWIAEREEPSFSEYPDIKP